MEQEEKLYDEVETEREFTYHGDSVSACGGCEAAVTARTRCRWVKLRECSVLVHGRGFPQMLKGTFNKSYVMPAMLNRSVACRLKESEM